MQLNLINIKSYLKTSLSSADTLSIRYITKKHLPYFIGWIGIFIWLYSYFLPMGEFKFESSLYNDNVGYTTIYYYVCIISGCLIAVLFSEKKYVPYTFYSVLSALACFFTIRYTGPTITSKILMVIASACIGHIFASNIYGFFMILNNSEKFYSIILAVLLPKVLISAKPVLNKVHAVLDPGSIIILFVIIILAVCSYFFKLNMDEIPKAISVKAPVNAYSLMPLVLVVLSLNDVIAPASLNQIRDIPKLKVENWYFIGVLIGISIVILLQKRFLINICNMLNISFAMLAIGFVMNIMGIHYSNAGLYSAICFGCSYSIGFINIYYLAGLMAKKLESLSFYKTGIIMSAIYYIIALIIMEAVTDSTELAPPILMAFVSICIVILFFLLTPFFIKVFYSGEWIDDTYRTDVTTCSRLEAKLKDYKLTPAEIEVCRLLLDGCTLRQIAGIQSKAYATINTYCTSIYRKLNINSRAELLLFLQDYVTK